MVGRELHTICPHGEDHQGDDRARRPNGDGTTTSRRTSRGLKKLKIPRMKTGKALNMISVHRKKELFQMNYILLALIWVALAHEGEKEMHTMKTPSLPTKKGRMMRNSPRLSKCNSCSERRRTFWSIVLWIGYNGLAPWGSQTSS